MEKIIFIFTTPEGGGDEVAEILKLDGFNVNESCNKDLWRLYDFAKTLKSGVLGDGSDVLKNLLFERKGASEKWGIKDEIMGKNFGYGFKMWVFLAMSAPTAKFIFCHKPLENNIIKIAANNSKWIPHYGSCLGNCEKNLKNQISQQQQFCDFYDKRAILVNDLDQERILNFANS